MKSSESLPSAAQKIESVFTRNGVSLTLGGEPTFVPDEPIGSEWSITALGPTKLRYAYQFADALIKQALPNALAIYSPGKLYPGEVNPRWAINLVWRRDGAPHLKPKKSRGATKPSLAKFREAFSAALRLKSRWLRAIDTFDPEREAWALPLDHAHRKFVSADWQLGPQIELLRAEGPAGLRLPLALVPADVSRRALTAEMIGEEFHVFLPPLLQAPFVALLGHVFAAASAAGLPTPILSGYVPHDEADLWSKLAIAADPGVLELNLPPCETWRDYDWWMHTLDRAATSVGLRSFKQFGEEQTGTGGGNHLLFGGPSLDRNPLFTRPGWVTSMARYWQHHPSLSYLFTGVYVGKSSQAPRVDESASALYDLEMAYQFLEQLPPGDHRQIISETLRHLHTDTSGNTHRAELSFDKFWNAAFDGGCRGLIEFRAIESMPRPEWMSAVALLWRAIAAMLLEKPFTKPLVDHADRLHDSFFLPTHLWTDFEEVLTDLRKVGVPLPEESFRAIWEWRFPLLLEHEGKNGERLTIRKALESWPLLCEQPLEGGTTSRFVDTSIERLEFLANRKFSDNCTIHVHGRKLVLEPLPKRQAGAGLRYRRSALYPSLHPGIPPQLPLFVAITCGREHALYRLDFDRRKFERCDVEPVFTRGLKPCKKLKSTLLTCDLRLP